MKVIFLDIDGVLNSDEYIDLIKGKEMTAENEIDMEKVRLLEQAINQTGARVVLTASGRYAQVGRYLRKVLSQRAIFTDVTPYMNNIRGLEIKEWLSQNSDVEDFVILDDEIFESYDEELLSKLIKISNGNGRNLGEGLLQKDIDEIVNRLGKNIVQEKFNKNER